MAKWLIIDDNDADLLSRGDGSAITLTDKEIDRALLRAFRLSTQSKRVAVFREAIAALIQQAQEARDVG